MSRVIRNILQWGLAVICVPLAIPVILAIPGNPNGFELAVYAAVLLSVTHYPIVLPVFAVTGWIARRHGRAGIVRVADTARWVAFAPTCASISLVAAILALGSLR